MLIALDANCIIYWVEDAPLWAPKVESRLLAGLAAGDKFHASHLTRAECLVGPFKSGDRKVEADFHLFFASPAVTLTPITFDVCERAARLRADHNFKMPDALNLASAILHGCDRFLTNDANLVRCNGIVVEVLA